MAVANCIKEVRKAKHIEPEELANAIQCTTRTIARYESGERTPTLELALRLCAYLGVDPEDLFTVVK